MLISGTSGSRILTEDAGNYRLWNIHADVQIYCLISYEQLLEIQWTLDMSDFRSAI